MQGIEGSQGGWLDPTCLVESVGVDTYHITLGQQPFGTSRSSSTRSPCSPTELRTMQVRNDPQFPFKPFAQCLSFGLGSDEFGQCRGVEIPDLHVSARRRAAQQAPPKPTFPHRAGDLRRFPGEPQRENGRDRVRSDLRLLVTCSHEALTAARSLQLAVRDRSRSPIPARVRAPANDWHLFSTRGLRSSPCVTW